MRRCPDRPCRRGGHGAPRQSPGITPRGIALVLVLWVLALLTVMALGLTTVQRSESALTRNLLDGARFRALADAAVALAAIDLLAVPLDLQLTDSGALWVPDGSPRTLTFDGEEVTVRLTNEASRLDLNTADPTQLQTLIALALAAAEGDTDAQSPAWLEPAAQFADAIADWRDADDLTLLNGAEDGDYEAAGAPVGAGDRPFQSVLELRQVLGMTPELVRRLEPDLTVDNPGGAVDLNFASAAVLAAVQGVPLADAELTVAERDAPLPPGAALGQPVNRGGPLYRLRISRGGQTMEVLVRVQQGAQVPYEVLWRREGLYDEAPAAEAP